MGVTPRAHNNVNSVIHTCTKGFENSVEQGKDPRRLLGVRDA